MAKTFGQPREGKWAGAKRGHPAGPDPKSCYSKGLMRTPRLAYFHGSGDDKAVLADVRVNITSPWVAW